MDLVLAGDSHTWSFDEALVRMSDAERAALGRRIRVIPFLLGHETATRFCSRAGDRIELHPQGRFMNGAPVRPGAFSPDDRAVVWGFSLGLMTTVLLRRQIWRQFAPWSVAALCGRQPLSVGVVEAVARAANQYVREFYAFMVSLEIPCFCIAAPPLSINEPALEGGVALMVEVDFIARRAMAAEIEALGVRVIWPPDEAYQGVPRRSLLHESFVVTRDSHHATAGYGRLMLEHILKETSDLRPWLILPTLGVSSPTASNLTRLSDR